MNKYEIEALWETRNVYKIFSEILGEDNHL